ncbi:beta-galactosidase [Persicitalea jodogahamensis]|uniref:Beta-galactosidase n=1 Tax=Persicitalea jodogahamensis TaxID=402147 RepID=A0A8J3D385_9BACT|nr:beta-galactosidase [Persicitalea jodogahamensis]
MIILTIFLVSFTSLTSSAQSQRTRLTLNRDWVFTQEKNEDQLNRASFNLSQLKPVNLPHIFEWVSMDLNGSKDDKNQKTFQRTSGYYAKDLSIKPEPDRKYFLEFEGVHQVTDVWVNGRHVGQNALGGYTPFSFDITAFLQAGKPNRVVIKADNTVNSEVPPDGDKADFIRYNGLYRDVYLVTTHPVHVGFAWEEADAGIFITTPSVTPENATVSIRTTVKNESAKVQPVEVVQRIIDADRRVVAKLSDRKKIAANATVNFRQTAGIEENLQLWSIDTPYLYQVLTEILIDGKVVDHQVNSLGIRKIEFLLDKGFLLNGNEVELIGVNRHQQFPFIGDAASNTLHRADALQFKKMGFNVVRLAHYPHDDSFIEACDELGILLYEEAPTWIHIGNQLWMDRLVESTRVMIRNHRNHPSIIMWSGGINHRGPVPALHYAAKEEDPTRPTASNGSPWTGPRNSGVTDLYTPMDYQGLALPEGELMFLCEHGSSADAHTNQLEVSKSRQATNRIGAAAWTAHEYLAFERDDLMNLRRPFSIFRQTYPLAYWYQSEMIPSPMVYIADERVSKDGKVIVFSNCPEVELYHNDQLIARQTPDFSREKAHLNHPSFTFDFDWKGGELRAVAFHQKQVAAEFKSRKSGQPFAIKMSRTELDGKLSANGSDMTFVYAQIVDDKGAIVYDDSTEVRFEIIGDAKLEGDQASGANPIKASFGTAAAIIRTGTTAGPVLIKATAKNLRSGEISLEIGEEVPEDYPVFFEEKAHRLDLGNTKNKLVQFGWENINDTNLKNYPLANFGKAKLAFAGTYEFEDNFGAVGDLPYLVNDGILARNGSIGLRFSDLPKGKYELTFYQYQIDEKTDYAIKQSITIEDEQGKRVATGLLPKKKSSGPTSVAEPIRSTYTIHSDGRKDISVQLSTLDQGKTLGLNGLTIKELN